MNVSARTVVVGTLALLLSLAPAAFPASPEKLTGSISGWVTNSLGIPQMGAAVLLFDRHDGLVSRALTDEAGAFLFDSLRPDVYSLRVTLASFLPALKRNIVVQPGMKSLLSVNLAGVLSSIELVYSATGDHAVMSDEWKWVLRTSSATRPVLRIGPNIDISDPTGRHTSSAVFSETRGMVKVSAGDEGRVSSYGNEPDLGTAFALATSLYGTNQLQVSGNVGYSAVSGMPSAGFSTRYSRLEPGGSSPEVQLTMRQLFLPTRAGTALLTGQEGGAPALRTMSVGFMDRSQLTDDLHLEYGFSLESVTFLDRLNYFSPYARLTYSQNEDSAIDFGFSSGLPPVNLLSAGREPGAEMQQDLASLSLFPRVSLKDGRVRVQRAENFEIAYRKTIGSRTYSLAAYREGMSNVALTMVSPSGFPAADLLPDLLSNSSVFNIGNYAGFGYMASVTQTLGDNLDLALAYGSGSALIPTRQNLETDRPGEIRGIMNHGRRYYVTTRISGSVPWAGTQIITSYRWADGNSLNAGHYYITQAFRPEIGLNIFVRQPIRAFAGLPGKLEATADLRNLLEEGYIPLTTPDGRRVILMHTPRSVRGGLSFIF